MSKCCCQAACCWAVHARPVQAAEEAKAVGGKTEEAPRSCVESVHHLLANPTP